MSTKTTKAAEPAAEVVDAAPRQLPAVDPRDCRLQAGGMCYSEWFIRLPAGALADDLKEIGLWRRVQAGNRPLSRFDHVKLISDNEEWMADAVVGMATRAGAELVGIRIVKLASGRHDRLFCDENYRVGWSHGSYFVERLRDRFRMPGTFGSEPLAVAEIRRLYPQKVA